MFADRQHRVHRHPVATDPQRFRDRRIDLDAIRPGHVARHLPSRELVDVQAHDIHPRVRLPAVEQVRFQEVLKDHVGVASIGELRDDGGDPQLPGRADARHHPSHAGLQVIPARLRHASSMNRRRDATGGGRDLAHGGALRAESWGRPSSGRSLSHAGSRPGEGPQASPDLADAVSSTVSSRCRPEIPVHASPTRFLPRPRHPRDIRRRREISRSLTSSRGSATPSPAPTTSGSRTSSSTPTSAPTAR